MHALAIMPFFLSVTIFLNSLLISYFGIIGGAIAFILFLFMYAGLLAFKSASIVNATVFDLFDFKKLATIIAVSVLFILPFYWLCYVMNFNIIFVVGSAAVFLLAVYSFLWKRKIMDNQLLNQLAVKIRLVKK